MVGDQWFKNKEEIIMFNVQIDENVVKELCVEEIQKKVKEYDAELAFWDTKELKKRVCMSWNTIQDQFFFDPRFPKFKVGKKWYFPAKQVQAFLVEWAEERMD